MDKRKYGVFNKISNIRKNVYAREDDKFSPMQFKVWE